MPAVRDEATKGSAIRRSHESEWPSIVEVSSLQMTFSACTSYFYWSPPADARFTLIVVAIITVSCK